MRKAAEIEHADEAEKFMKHVTVDHALIAKHFQLWRDVADQMYTAMYEPTVRESAATALRPAVAADL